MNKAAENKAKRIPMPGQKPQKIPREQWAQHPLFGSNMMHELSKEEVIFPVDDIPAGFKTWLLIALADIPFPNLKMATATYWKLINQQPAEWTFGVLQKSVDIVWNSTPGDCALNTHYDKIIAVGKMRTTFEAIISPIRERVIDELILQEAPSIIKG